MKCPYCSKPTSDIGKKCVHCGKDLDKSFERIKTVSVKCPHCNVKTEIINLAGVELDYCYKCSGIWFDKGELKEFQEAISDQDTCGEMINTLQEILASNKHATRKDYLNCPVCSQTMSHKQFEDVSGIILDQCVTHGTWTEQEDLLKILELIHSDGLDNILAKKEKYNQQKLDNKIKELESKQARLNSELSSVRSFSRTHFFLDFLGFI